jgi:hypothetical protein
MASWHAVELCSRAEDYNTVFSVSAKPQSVMQWQSKTWPIKLCDRTFFKIFCLLNLHDGKFIIAFAIYAQLSGHI